MKCLSLLSGLVLLCASRAFAQAPDTVWSRTFGESSYDGAADVLEKVDGSFIICGYKGIELAPNAYTTDIWIFQTDNAGILWDSHTYGGMGAVSMTATSDGGYMVLANTFSSSGSTWEDMLLIKLKGDGDTVWTRLINPSTHDEGTGEVHETADSGFLVLFYGWGATSALYLYRTDASGKTLWTRTYDAVKGSLVITDDDGFVLMGRRDSTWVLKADKDGNTVWRKAFLGEFKGSQILQTTKPEYLIIGQTYPLGPYSPRDIGIMRISGTGDSLSLVTYSVENNPTLLGRATKTREQSVIISGATSPAGYAPGDGLVLQVDSVGTLQWMRVVGWEGEDFIGATHELSRGGFIAAGTTTSLGKGKTDVWLLKLSEYPTFSAGNESKPPSSFWLMQNYPNPFNPSTTIRYGLPHRSHVTLTVFNTLGQQVAVLQNGERDAGYHEVKFEGSKLASGVYLYRMQAGSYVETRKFLLVR